MFAPVHLPVNPSVDSSRPPPVPHVVLAITKSEVGGAQTHVLELYRALQGRVRFTVVSWLSAYRRLSLTGLTLWVAKQ